MKKTLLRVGIIAAVILLVVMLGSNLIRLLFPPKPKIITESTLEQILNLSDLSTYEAVYNGIAEIHNEKDPEKIDYYVSYCAKIKAGLDFEKVATRVDEEEKTITVTLPPIEITDVNVNITTLDYIFVNKKAETETVSQEAYKASLDDVTNETSSQNAIFERAEENAQNVIKALIEPFVAQFDAEYTLVIKQEGRI